MDLSWNLMEGSEVGSPSVVGTEELEMELSRPHEAQCQGSGEDLKGKGKRTANISNRTGKTTAVAP